MAPRLVPSAKVIGTSTATARRFSTVRRGVAGGEMVVMTPSSVRALARGMASVHHGRRFGERKMQRKIGLEEHFAIPETLSDSRGYLPDRSEERRVGKECRWRWAGDG